MLIKKTINHLKANGLTATFVKIGEYQKYKKAALRYMRDNALSPEELELQRETEYKDEVLISLVTPAYNTDREYLLQLLDSVQAQTYANWELVIVDASDSERSYVGEIINELMDKRIVYKKLTKNKGISENTNVGLGLTSGKYIALLDHDDVLSENALFEFRQAIDSGADFIYSDEASFATTPKKSTVIHLKPDFAPDNLRGNNYICHLSMFERSLFDKVGGLRSEYDGSQDHDFILRLTENATNIVHIKKVLYFWRIHKNSVASDISAKPYCITSGIKAVSDQLKRLKIKARVEEAENAPSAYRVIYKTEKLPSISILNRSNNYHAQKAEAEYLAFIDKSIEPLNEAWKKELVMLLEREDVGIAGGEIIYGKKILSGGIILLADRYSYAYNKTHISSTGYMKRLKYIQDVSALPNGFFMIKKSLFEEIGGFNEKLRGDEKIIDLCLRLRQKGLLVVFNPYAVARLNTKPKRLSPYSRAFTALWSEELSKEDKFFSSNFVKYLF